MIPLIRSASLTGYVDIARSSGLDPYRMMRESGLNPSCLRDPEIRISVAAVRQLLESSANEGNIPDLGLRMAESRRLSNLGPISLLLREEPTARKALELLLRHMRLINQSLVTRLEDGDGLVVIRHEFDIGEAVSVRQAMELAVGVMFRMLKELLGPHWAPRRVCFRHVAPASLASHVRVFGRFVEFGRDFNGIVCSARDLEARNPSADPAMARYAQQYLRSLLAEPDMTTADRVRQLAHLLLPARRCTIEAIAEQLGMDRRTIHRHLAREATTFTALLCAVRAEHAARYLEDGNRPLSEVADALGFSAPSALSRWFRAEFGCGMNAWRRAPAAKRRIRARAA